ncbi:MAG: hypothetical protein ACYTGL_20290 [Planctomycetota bacterium]|jgi:hypothetical protein
MTLKNLTGTIRRRPIPHEVAAFLRDAEDRVNDYIEHSRTRVGGFVPCDFVAAWHTLRTISDQNLSAGQVFCEWGSGFGVVACLASLLGFEAYGIEIEERLLEESRELADAHDLPVEFVLGSFIPDGSAQVLDEEYSHESFWLSDDTQPAYDELELWPEDFDVVFAYPWPNEETAIDRMFDQTAGKGALLLTYSQLEEVRIKRKIR